MPFLLLCVSKHFLVSGKLRNSAVVTKAEKQNEPSYPLCLNAALYDIRNLITLKYKVLLKLHLTPH